MKPEQKVYQAFYQNIHCSCHVQRIEAVSADGIPDVMICNRGKVTWVELKVYENGVVYIRPAQYAWGRRHASHGGKVLVVAKRDDGKIDVWKYPNFSVKSISKDKYVTPTDMPDSTILLAQFFQVYLQ